MRTTILLLNLIASLASVTWAAVALFRPASLSGSNLVGEGETFYARMYAARAIPFGIGVGVLPFWGGGIAVTSILIAAAFVQVADIFIGVERSNRRMMGGCGYGRHYARRVCPDPSLIVPDAGLIWVGSVQ